MATPASPMDDSAEVYGEAHIQSLAASLGDSNGIKRQRAREALVLIGHPAVPALLAALKHPNSQVRWEAAKALREIADRRTIDPLLTAMEDDEPEIRWLAGEALAAIGPPVVVPLLSALTQKADQTQFRMGAHFVLRSLKERGLDGVIRPVLEALEGVEPSMEVPVAAGRALVQLSDQARDSLAA